MLTVDPTVQTLLDEGRTIVRGLMKFEFGTGTYGFINSDVPFSWGGLAYHPGGVIEVSDLPGAVGMAAQPFTITLSASPDDGLTPEILRTIEAEDYRDRPVTIYDAHFHPDTGVLVSVMAMRRGYVDVIDHEDDESGYRLVASCETRALDYTRTNGRRRSHADQQRRASGDRFLEHASKRGRVSTWWGRVKKEAAQAGNNFLGALRDKVGLQ